MEWNELKREINLTKDEEEAVRLEERIIETMIHIREDKGLSQAQLAKICKIKQPSLARMEKGNHSPQIDSLLKVLVPMGYTLEIVPLRK